jgi:hypothetical protein
MYYSGARRTTTLRYNFQTNAHHLNEDIWILETWNNEQKGGNWERVFIGHALEDLKDYFVYRFKLDRSTLEDEISRKVVWLRARIVFLLTFCALLLGVWLGLRLLRLIQGCEERHQERLATLPLQGLWPAAARAFI